MLGEEAVEVGKPVAAAVSETHRDEHDVDRVDERNASANSVSGGESTTTTSASLLSWSMISAIRLGLQVDLVAHRPGAGGAAVAVTGRLPRAPSTDAAEEKVSEPAALALAETRLPPAGGSRRRRGRPQPPAASAFARFTRSSSSLGFDALVTSTRRGDSPVPARRQAGAQGPIALPQVGRQRSPAKVRAHHPGGREESAPAREVPEKLVLGHAWIERREQEHLPRREGARRRWRRPTSARAEAGG